MPVHLLIHFSASILAGLIIACINSWHDPLLIFTLAVLGGFLVDCDHLIEYYIAFGTKFRFDYFFKGYSFLKTDKFYLILHAWEICLLLPLFFLVDYKVGLFISAFNLGLFFHLVSDVFINHIALASYSLTYRFLHKFRMKELVSQTLYQEHIREQAILRKKGII